MASWPVDCALIVVSAGLGLRAYNAFTAEGSYAPYYAAPLVLLLGILHQRVVRALALGASRARWARSGSSLSGCSPSPWAGSTYTTRRPCTRRAARSSRLAQGASALQATIRQVDRDSEPGQAILAAPTDGGLYFMTDRRPALHELTLLPGLLATPAAEAAAVARLRQQHPALAVIGARDLSVWGTPTFGVDYYKLLGAYLRGETSTKTVLGTLTDPSGGTIPSKGFTILQLRSEQR